MQGRGGLREILAKAEQQPVRWAAVVLGIVVLLWLKLILFAAALPLMAYWHFSNQSEDSGDPGPEECQGPEGDADLDRGWPSEDEDAEAEESAFQADRDCDPPMSLGKDNDPYDSSFWAPPEVGGPQKRNAPWRSTARTAPEPPKMSTSSFDDGDLDNHDSFGLDPLLEAPVREPLPPVKPKPTAAPWDADASPANHDSGYGLSSSSKGSDRGPTTRPQNNYLGLGRGGDHDPFEGLGLSDDLPGTSLGDDFGMLGEDMDLFGGSMSGGRGRGKGKGKSKGNDKGGFRDPAAPREPNPKQVFVANVGDLEEEDIRTFFERVGEVDRLKVLRNPDGGSKGVCFVTFRTEEQAQKALALHGSNLEGRNLVVKLAHGGNKGGEKGGEKGGKGHERTGPLHDGFPDLGGHERFGLAFDSERERGDRGDRGDRGLQGFSKGSRSGKGSGKRNDRGEMDELLEEALADGDGPIRPGDFDFAARRFLSELRSRDRTAGTSRFQEAIDMVLKYTSSKDRSSVRKWPAYIFTLLQKFDPNLWEELRERDAERRREKGKS